MSDSSPSTSHLQKIQHTVSPKLHWLSLWNVHCTRFGNISKPIDDGILRRSTPAPRSAVLNRAVRIERSVESRKYTPCRRVSSLCCHSIFHHIREPHIHPYTSAIIQMLYHVLGGIRQSFFSLLTASLGFTWHSCQCLFTYIHTSLSQPIDTAKHPPNASIIALCILRFVVGTRMK